MNKKIPVVIPHYKEADKLKKCLSALHNQSYQPIEIYVRDNSEDNILFTAAVNEGILKYVGERDVDYILVLNQDAYVEKSAINELVKTLEENPKCGIACPIQIQEGTSKISWAGGLDAYPSGVHNCTNLDALERDLKTYWANGAAMLLRKEMIRQIGVFDVNMKFICSDSDYSFMARSRGWSVMTSANARVFHSFSTSGNVSNLTIERVKLKDMLYFSNKWLNGELYRALAYEGDKLTRLKIKTQIEKIEEGNSTTRHIDRYRRRLLSTMSNRTDLVNAAQYHFDIGSLDFALAILRTALIKNPQDVDASKLMGYIFIAKGNKSKAIEFFANTLQGGLRTQEIFYQLGALYLDSNEVELAIETFLTGLSELGSSFEIEHDLGVAYAKLKQYESAGKHFEAARSINPSSEELFFNVGRMFDALKQHSNALASYQKAIAIDPNYAQAWYNQGAALHDLGRYDEALASYDRAIEIYPAYAQAWSNKGVTFSCLGDQQKALEFFQKSLSIDSNYADAGWNLSLIYLLLGNFHDGWKTHECRWIKEDPHPYLHSERPQLNSLDDIAGKRILVWAEQGYGDTIHFCRFAPLLADLGATVIFEVQPPLVELINSLRDCHVIPRGQAASNIDYQIPLLSLPALLGADLDSIPAITPYLQVSDIKVSQWKQRLQLSSSQLNVGIACSGNMHHQNDVNRSMPLSTFAPLLADKRLNIFLVQKDLRKEDSMFYEQAGNLQFLGASIGDFEDSAAIVQNLDIIISVDTSLVHLAGALGKEVLVLLPWVAEWRWLMDRKDSPWYPTATLIRQPNPGNWSAVIEAVGQLLSKKDLGV